MSTTIDDAVQQGRNALARYAWREAFEAMKRADAEGRLAAEDLEGLGDAAWWIGEGETVVDARERAFAAYIEAGDKRRAAHVAIMLARDYNARLARPQATGWFRRAEQLVAEDPETSEAGWIAFIKAGHALDAGEFEQGASGAEEALSIATQAADRDLQALALQRKGDALISMGRVDEGLGLIDEAMVGAVGGELGPLATGIVYCNTISTCERLADYRRAGDWTEAATRWCERQSIAGFPGICRVHRAEITQLRGDWKEAEAQARQACTELRGARMLQFAGDGFYEVGEIRLRIGDLDAAEEAFRQAHEMGREPQPGLALLRLRQGKPDAAASMMRRAIEDVVDRLERAKMLTSYVEVMVAAGDLDSARAGAEEMEAIVADFTGPAQQARAAMARGIVQLAEGDAAGAIRSFRRGWERWRGEEVPYEAARARALLGEAYRAEGDEDSAALELRAAKAAFEKLGAVPDEMRVAALLGEGTSPVAGPRVVRTFMFTDIERSTNLVEAMGDEAWEELLAWHDGTLRKRFAEHGGQEVDHTGDGFFVAFPDARTAIECAVAIQRALAEHRRTHGFAPKVRIGLHAAEAMQQGENYRGKGVHEAARVGALASGGEIVATAATVESAGDGVRTSGPREATLKGISEPVKVVSVEWR